MTMNILQPQHVESLRALSSVKFKADIVPFTPQVLFHIYVKLDFEPRFESASNADDARDFLRSVARAGIAADRIAEQYQGLLLELQGSILHIALPSHSELRILSYASDLHWAYRLIFNNNQGRVRGWRMTTDVGPTLVVPNRSVHGDISLVSLGNAANRPAKQLYRQLELDNEEVRALKRFFLGVREPSTDSWRYIDLDGTPKRTEAVKQLANEARKAELSVQFINADSGHNMVTASALPIGPAGTPSSPSADKPEVHFGWVMRADLDGFTACVKDCFDHPDKLQELAVQFSKIMDAAAAFTKRHSASLAQLPWSGDNFTAAAVFPSKDKYEESAPKKLVELALDFEREMEEAAVISGFGGWAYGIAGGTVHGNANGNIYIAGVEVRSRRFLVGAGEGMWRSSCAFTDVDPKRGHLAVFVDDYDLLDNNYREKFLRTTNQQGQESSLFRIATAVDLIRSRAAQETGAARTIVTFPAGQSRTITTKPYSQ